MTVSDCFCTLNLSSECHLTFINLMGIFTSENRAENSSLRIQRMVVWFSQPSTMQVTNEVFRHAKLTGAGYINKPKMRDYVHCYALHCLDLEQSNALRKMYKERGENVGAWCQACYYPLVSLARENEWDIDDLFNRNEKLRIWYVPTKLRQLCHIERIKHGE